MSNIFDKLYHWSQREPKSREAQFYRKLHWKFIFFLAWFIPKQLYLFLTPEYSRTPEGFYLYVISVSLCFHFLLFPVVAIFRKGFWKIVWGLGWLLGITYPLYLALDMYIHFFRLLTIHNKTVFPLLILYDLTFFLAFTFWIVRKVKEFDAAYTAPLKKANP